jgi:hypothetical protein
MCGRFAQAYTPPELVIFYRLTMRSQTTPVSNGFDDRSRIQVATIEEIDLEWLLKVRTVVARIGEMDRARWWNSNGQLGPQGAAVLRRGLPRTHYFAQARSVFMVASNRCAQVFDPPDCVTLWRLTDVLEDRLDVLWEEWLDDAAAWRPFFERIAGITSTDVSTTLLEFGLVSVEEIGKRNGIRKSSDGRSIQIPGLFDGGRETVALLALAFGAGAPGTLVVPYARRADA